MMDETIDIARLLRRVGGNQRVLEKLMRLTIDAAPAMMADVRTATARRDRAALAGALHSLRGAMGLVAGDALGSLAGQLEAAAHDASFEALEEMRGALEGVVHRCITALEQLVREQGVGGV